MTFGFLPSSWPQDVPAWLISLIVSAIVFGILFKFMRSDSYSPEPAIFFLLFSVAGSLAWINLIIGLIIDVLELLQTISGLPALVLGMTIMAVGNSCTGIYVNDPDMTVDPTLAAEGHELMAITGIFAGQMFNFLLGFSISCFMKTLA